MGLMKTPHLPPIERREQTQPAAEPASSEKNGKAAKETPIQPIKDAKPTAPVVVPRLSSGGKPLEIPDNDLVRTERLPRCLLTEITFVVLSRKPR